WQTEPIPLLREIEGQPLGGPIRSSNPGFVQMAVVVRAKPLKESKDPAAILSCAIRELVPCPVIEGIRDDHVFIDVERSEDSLSEHIHDVVIGIGSIVEIGAKRPLLFLCLQDAMSIRRMKNEAFEIELPDATYFGPWLKR